MPHSATESCSACPITKTLTSSQNYISFGSYFIFRNRFKDNNQYSENF